MSDQKKLDEIAAQFSPEMDVTTGKWFGKPCIKAAGKVFVVLFEDDLVFKLADEAHAEALQVEGAHLFDPRGKGHPMKQWVQIPEAQSSTWERFAEMAYRCVAGASQARKDSVIAELVDSRGKLLQAAASLSLAQRGQVFLGVWSAKELLAHLVGWDYANREAAQAILAGKMPAFYAHYDRDWATYNAHLVAEHRKEDWDELVAAVEDSHRGLVGFLETIPAEEFDKDRGVRFKGYKVTIARLLQVEARDEREHDRQIREFAAGQ